jgi:hypothetical protein
MKKKTKQLAILNLKYPFESVHTLLFNSDYIKKIFDNSEYKIKFFIGSDWSIKNSGFSFYGPNGLNSVLELLSITENDFIRENNFSNIQINGERLNIELITQFSLINNTCDNTSIIEIRFNYQFDEDLIILEKYIKISHLKEILKKIMTRIEILFSQSSGKEKIPKIILNQSFIIKKNYKDAFNFFYNWNNIAKALKTDKGWKIVNEENYEKDKHQYKNFYILINNDIRINYRVQSINEVKNEKIEIVYDKSGKNYVPALNNYIKFTFFNINSELTLFLYETHLPFNIASSIYKTVSYYLFYCNNQSRNYIENL